MNETNKSKKTRPGDVITSPTSGPVLNGTLMDAKMVEELYAADREIEALKILDRMLELPKGITPAVDRLRFLMTNSRMIEIDMRVNSVSEESAVCEVKPKLGGAYARTLMIIRSKCFSAIMDRPSGREDANLTRQAIENAEVVVQLFPEDPIFLTLAAQVFFFQGDTNRANNLVKQALVLHPGDEVAKATLNLIHRGHDAEDYASMTERALMIIDEILHEGRNTKDIVVVANLLNQSLDIFETQPRAWAGIAWIYASINQKGAAIEALRKAQKYNPSDDMVQEIANGLDKLGWLDEQENAFSAKRPWWKFGK